MFTFGGATGAGLGRLLHMAVSAGIGPSSQMSTVGWMIFVLLAFGGTLISQCMLRRAIAAPTVRPTSESELQSMAWWIWGAIVMMTLAGLGAYAFVLFVRGMLVLRGITQVATETMSWTFHVGVVSRAGFCLLSTFGGVYFAVCFLRRAGRRNGDCVR